MRSLGKFGPYDGVFVSELLMPTLEALEEAYESAKNDPAFNAELQRMLKDYAGRPTPLYLAENVSKEVGAKIYLKREDLLHGGAHKTNNTLGQALLARRMGKKRLVAETGAGQHGVATATVAALFGMECTVYMGEVDMARQRPNVLRMRLLGATIVPVTSGSRTLKDATNETIRDWVTNVRTTHYIIGSTVGPHPYPTIVRDFQSIIGREARAQIIQVEERLPSDVVACVGGGSNAMGIFSAFIPDAKVRLFGVEAAGSEHGQAATLNTGTPGVLHGAYSYLIQDENGQVGAAHSVAAGLDYPGVGPEHSMLKDSGRVSYERANDADALAAFQTLARSEGILPALEPSHALAFAKRHFGRDADDNTLVIVNLSGRGDKDMDSIAELLP